MLHFEIALFIAAGLKTRGSQHRASPDHDATAKRAARPNHRIRLDRYVRAHPHALFRHAGARMNSCRAVDLRRGVLAVEVGSMRERVMKAKKIAAWGGRYLYSRSLW